MTAHLTPAFTHRAVFTRCTPAGHLRVSGANDAIRLQQQLEELQSRLLTLEKKTEDYESVQAELEEKKGALETYRRMSEEMDKLKQQNSKTMTENIKLEDQLKNLEELSESQSLENALLKREKASVENILLETQTSLKKSQAQADRVDQLIEENAKTTIIKNNIENKVKLLEDSVNHKIHQLTNENNLLLTHIDDLQMRLMKLERERNKEYRSTSTQARAPEEPKVDKEKFQMLLQNLWACVEPKQQLSVSLTPVSESGSKPVPPCSPRNRPRPQPSSASQSSPHKPHVSPRRLAQTSGAFTQLKPFPDWWKETDTPKVRACLSMENKTEASSADLDGSTKSVGKILALFKPMLPCISPLPDSDTEMESMEATDCDKEKHPQLSDDGVLHAREESRLAPTSITSHEPNSSAPPTEETADLPEVPTPEVATAEVTTLEAATPKVPTPEAPTPEVATPDVPTPNVSTPEVTTQEVEHVPNDPEGSAQHELSAVTEMKNKRGTSEEEMHLEVHMPIEQDPVTVQLASASSSSSVSDVTLLESHELGGGAESTSQSENSPQEPKEDRTEPITEMEVDASPSDGAGAESVAADGGESPRRSDATALPEETGNVWLVSSSVTSTDSVADTGATTTDSGSGVGESRQDCCGSLRGQDGEDGTVVEPQVSESQLNKDTEVPEDSPCLSSGGGGGVIVGASNGHVEEGLESGDASSELLRKKARGAGLVGVAASPSGSSDDIGPPPPSESPLLKTEAGERRADRQSAQANGKTPPKKDVDAETSNSRTLAGDGSPLSDSQETINYESLKENIHSACRQLSPTCLLPTLELQALEEVGVVEKAVGRDKESIHSACRLLSPTCLLPTLELHALEEDVCKDLLQDGVDARDRKEAKYNLRHLRSAASSKSAAATNGHNECPESGIKAPGRQSPRVLGGGKPSPPVARSSAARPPECIGQVRSEMGPPLPRLLTPLRTPPKAGKSINPRQAIGKLSFPSPMNRLASPTTPVQAHLTPTGQHPSSSSLNSPLRPNGVPSSPLQFGSATPKHAVPVPGRLPPPPAMIPSPSSSPSQENSMRILDTMYPELSAHGRTLSILRGNVGLGICSSESGTSPTATDGGAPSRFNSSSTAFTKTETRGGAKRPAAFLLQPKSSKCLRMDNCSPAVGRERVPTSPSSSHSSSNSGVESTSPRTPSATPLKGETTPPPVAEPPEQDLIEKYFKQIESQAFDLLPVIQSHLYVGNLPKKPVLRDEEKEVISEICRISSLEADYMMLPILNKLKAEKRDLSRNYMQALCRVYTGICRQKRDWEKAHILAYSLLTEDFPDSATLVLFMVTTWPSVLCHSSALCRAIHTVTKLKAPESVRRCLSAFLEWEKSPPCDIDTLISRTLSDIRSGSSRSFTTHCRYGHDVGTEAWQNIFALQLLCSHKKWKWTYDNILGKELWPLMNTWVTQPRGQQAPVSDMSVATILRLIGYLCHLGLKERCVSTVGTVANVMNSFGRHGQAEGVPWEVQLSAIYCIYDLSPCNPKQALEAIAEWRGETSGSVPPAVTSCITQLASVCRQGSELKKTLAPQPST
ncbi:little elongation complex subunit 1 isoform X2 [Clinocottus analis]|uniref:little elongation complex subunit 1 isoform X2 n=1 Tax=Clinocottus analis TaxID=304258 RepID=UPI0035BF4466